ncbi:unnamed protein product [Fraxinus pennsylvanica]|uniref:Uncharacterized protein n=1 Tax=Fraxinus pennsylvanica TaxID=56036 RepID=A0AAD2DHE6_9LAMI|nr:unnamed protein product [Fraxinus pennsylvanica]
MAPYDIGQNSDGIFSSDGPILPPPTELQSEEGFALHEWRRLAKNLSDLSLDRITEEQLGCDTVFVTPTARTIDISHAWVMKNAITLVVSPVTCGSITEMLRNYVHTTRELYLYGEGHDCGGGFMAVEVQSRIRQFLMSTKTFGYSNDFCSSSILAPIGGGDEVVSLLSMEEIGDGNGEVWRVFNLGEMNEF